MNKKREKNCEGYQRMNRAFLLTATFMPLWIAEIQFFLWLPFWLKICGLMLFFLPYLSTLSNIVPLILCKYFWSNFIV